MKVLLKKFESRLADNISVFVIFLISMNVIIVKIPIHRLFIGFYEYDVAKNIERSIHGFIIIVGSIFLIKRMGLTKLSGIRFFRIDSPWLLLIPFIYPIGLFGYYLKYFSETPQKKSNDIIYITNSFICVVELCVYYYFFFRVLQNGIVKHTMKFLLMVFMIFFVGLIIFKTKKIDSYGHFAGIIGAAEFLFLLLPCFTYYFELFSNKTSEDLLKRPSFWIVTGIFFYSVVSIPYYLIANFLSVNKYHSRSELAIFMFYIPFSIVIVNMLLGFVLHLFLHLYVPSA